MGERGGKKTSGEARGTTTIPAPTTARKAWEKRGETDEEYEEVPLEDTGGEPCEKPSVAGPQSRTGTTSTTTNWSMVEIANTTNAKLVSDHWPAHYNIPDYFTDIYYHPNHHRKGDTTRVQPTFDDTARAHIPSRSAATAKENQEGGMGGGFGGKMGGYKVYKANEDPKAQDAVRRRTRTTT
ncbi:unnamed protein product [Symbiodinium natans]|uniref:Uncharacterized protein n=1 Tax=Symbiodinium natans TaxID=878477 RepID=A0A812GCU0_9DINO|nr:unnamed protein product [Symbiodinium natans]